MQIRRNFILSLLALPLLNRWSPADEAPPAEHRPAFEPGEKLKYSLGWQFIVAGHAALEVLPDEEMDGRKVRSFHMEARTVKVVDHLFKVRDSLSSVTEYDVRRSLGYAKLQREGKTKRDVTVDFDWDNLKAHYYEARSRSSRTIDIPENTLDPLSAFYFIRNQKLEVGTVIQGPMTDGKRAKEVEIKVVKRERIKVNGKKYDTFKLVPDMKDVGGVFEKSKDAKMEIWCTADDRHIPVLLKSKVMVGSFKAELEPK
jgi:hypothetical protein